MTRGIEASNYPEEKKITMISLVTASELETDQAESFFFMEKEL